uniref:hypothetical protein n=1 Tax=Agathobacter sp. TaxID=2021311 RepID=UPI0040574A76
MKFNNDLGMYVIEINGIIFINEDELSNDYEQKMQQIADNYWSNLTSIIEFMIPDLQDVYGNIDVKTVKEHLGTPTIDFHNGQVDYYEQSFDDIHIFKFEFLDDSIVCCPIVPGRIVFNFRYHGMSIS